MGCGACQVVEDTGLGAYQVGEDVGLGRMLGLRGFWVGKEVRLGMGDV